MECAINPSGLAIHHLRQLYVPDASANTVRAVDIETGTPSQATLTHHICLYQTNEGLPTRHRSGPRSVQL